MTCQSSTWKWVIYHWEFRHLGWVTKVMSCSQQCELPCVISAKKYTKCLQDTKLDLFSDHRNVSKVIFSSKLSLLSFFSGIIDCRWGKSLSTKGRERNHTLESRLHPLIRWFYFFSSFSSNPRVIIKPLYTVCTISAKTLTTNTVKHKHLHNWPCELLPLHSRTQSTEMDHSLFLMMLCQVIISRRSLSRTWTHCFDYLKQVLIDLLVILNARCLSENKQAWCVWALLKNGQSYWVTTIIHFWRLLFGRHSEFGWETAVSASGRGNGPRQWPSRSMAPLLFMPTMSCGKRDWS